jgi:hypothetical protein
MYNSNTERIIPKMRASPNVRRKLRIKHAVSMQEVYECFANRAGTFLEDARVEHATVPPTLMKSKQPMNQTWKRKGSMTNRPEQDDTELWESGQLGATEEFVRQVSPEREHAVDEALGLQPITIRLQRELVEGLKKLAKSQGIGYQPYVRLILTRHLKEQLGDGSAKVF